MQRLIMTTLFKNDTVEFARDETGAHFLIVLCGGIAMHECRVRLTPEEIAFIRNFGDFYILKLVADISHEPEKFRSKRDV